MQMFHLNTLCNKKKTLMYRFSQMCVDWELGYQNKLYYCLTVAFVL